MGINNTLTISDFMTFNIEKIKSLNLALKNIIIFGRGNDRIKN